MHNKTTELSIWLNRVWLNSALVQKLSSQSLLLKAEELVYKHFAPRT